MSIYERRVAGQSATPTGVVDEIIVFRRIDVVGKQAHFVVIATAVAVFRSVENWWGWV